jgi:O-antigen/teichoic acid export membrane protein
LNRDPSRNDEGGAFSALVRRIRLGRLARNTLYSTAGLVVRAVVQACYLIMLSRRMGSHDYGLFAGSVALAVLLAPLSGWGVSYVLSQHVARDPKRAAGLWATALVQIALSGSALVVVVLLTSTLLADHIDASAMLLLALAELVALPVAQAATTLCVVQGRGAAAATAICLVPVSRVIAVAALLLSVASATPDAVATFHFVGSLIGGFAAIGLIRRLAGRPDWRDRMSSGTTMAEGTRYALGSLVGTSYPEIDKVLLLQLAGATTAGTYTAAFRVVAVLLLPISALASNALPRLFAAQAARDRSHILRSVTLAAVAYGIVAMLGANLIAPLISDIFGASFGASSRYLQMLSIWVLPFAMHQCAAIGLTGSGRQWTRIVVEGGGALAIVIINVIAIPRLGGNGSVLALLTGEVLMAAACWTLLRTAIGHDESAR